MIRLRAVAVAIITATAVVSVTAMAANNVAGGKQGKAMTNERTILETSDDPRELMRAALAWTRETEEPVYGALLGFLTSQHFLDRLDSAEDYRAAASNRLRISRIVESLARNQSPGARQAFDALLRDKVFTADEERIEALIRASEFVRPPSANLVAFWNTYSQPDDGYVHVTVTALLRNGSEPALGVFAQLLADPNHDEGDKIAWLRSDLLSHRDEVEVLRMSERLLQGGLPASLNRALLEVLFDYRPGEWYRPANPSSPPDRTLAKPEALRLLRHLGRTGLGQLASDDPLRTKIEAELASIDIRLADDDRR